MIIYWESLEKNAGDVSRLPDYIASGYLPSVHFSRNLYWEGHPRGSGLPAKVQDYIASSDFIRGLNIQPVTWDGWLEAKETWAYASATTITVPSGAASKYSKGDKIKLTQTSVKYFYIVGVANTLLTITAGATYTLVDAAITNNFYSKAASPLGFPGWFDYTPTYTPGGAMTYTSVTTHLATFSIQGNTCHIAILAGGTVGGTPSGSIAVSLPAASAFGSLGRTACYIFNNGVEGASGFVQFATAVTFYLQAVANFTAGTVNLGIISTYEF